MIEYITAINEVIKLIKQIFNTVSKYNDKSEKSKILYSLCKLDADRGLNSINIITLELDKIANFNVENCENYEEIVKTIGKNIGKNIDNVLDSLYHILKKYNQHKEEFKETLGNDCIILDEAYLALNNLHNGGADFKTIIDLFVGFRDKINMMSSNTIDTNLIINSWAPIFDNRKLKNPKYIKFLELVSDEIGNNSTYFKNYIESIKKYETEIIGTLLYLKNYPKN